MTPVTRPPHTTVTLGQRLKYVRRFYGLSQSQLSDRMLQRSGSRVCPDSMMYSIGRWENDEVFPHFRSLLSIAAAFNLTASQLLDGVTG